MIFTHDMKEFIEIIEKYQVEYVVVGGFAVNYRLTIMAISGQLKILIF
jgi:phosphoribosylformylglycinamidine (FGAM) synthase-like enzyme